MNIIEAAKAVINGEKVRRPGWVRNVSYGANNADENICFYVRGGKERTMQHADFSSDDLLADDWEVIE